VCDAPVMHVLYGAQEQEHLFVLYPIREYLIREYPICVCMCVCVCVRACGFFIQMCTIEAGFNTNIESVGLIGSGGGSVCMWCGVCVCVCVYACIYVFMCVCMDVYMCI
jgi:hypothetical protein